MRINEIANAEEQLALWKLVSDNVWNAIHAQAQQQAREKQVASQQKKAKGKRKGKSRVANVPRIPNVPKPATPKAQNKLNPTAKTVEPNANAYNPNTNPTLKQQYPMPNVNAKTPTHTVQAPAPQANAKHVGGGLGGVEANANVPLDNPNDFAEPVTHNKKRLQVQKTGFSAVNRAY